MCMNPVFSIVIPVYNREKTIRYCLDSILNQKFIEWEAVVIDDGSRDTTFEICKDYQSKDNRFIAITQDNAGPSRARNRGIDKSKGEFIVFLDSDDAIGREFLESLYEIIQNGDYDLLMYESVGAIVKNDTWREVVSNNEIVEYCGPDIMTYFWGYPYSQKKIFVWNKLFNAHIIRNNNIRFQEDVNLGEDQVFLCSYLRYVNKFCLTTKILYYNLSVDCMPPGLGGTPRTSENYLHNQLCNYQALLLLYEYCRNEVIREFATNYIIDRVITRIGFRNVPSLFMFSQYKEFKNFISEMIIPLVKKERDNLNIVHDPAIRHLAQTLIDERIDKFIVKCRVRKTINEIVVNYYRLRYNIAKWLK